MGKQIPQKQLLQTDATHLAIDIVGKETEIWKKRRPRFKDRIFTFFKKLTEAKIPGRTTVHAEAEQAIENIVASSQAIFERPQLTNSEKQASIKVKLAEAKKLEAEARLLNAQADEKELDVEKRKEVLNSQQKINLSLQRGELLPFEKDGQIYFLYRPNEIESDISANPNILHHHIKKPGSP